MSDRLRHGRPGLLCRVPGLLAVMSLLGGWGCAQGGGPSVTSFRVPYVSSAVPAVGPSGRIYFGAMNGVCAVSLGTHRVLWNTRLGWLNVVTSNPVVSRTCVFVPSTDDRLYAVDLATGAVAWSFKSSSVLSEPALSADGRLVYVRNAGHVYALTARTGAQAWCFRTPSSILGTTLAAPGGRVYVGSRDGNLYALNGHSGRVIWKFNTGAAVDAPCAVSTAGSVYVASASGVVYCVSRGGARLWAFDTHSDVIRQPVVGPNGALYVVNWAGDVYALEGRTGTLRWRVTGTGLWKPAAVEPDFLPMALGQHGTLYLVVDHCLYALSGTTGRVLWTLPFSTFVSGPIVLGGDVVCVASDRRLWLVGGGMPADGATKTLRAVWPCAGGNPQRTGECEEAGGTR